MSNDHRSMERLALPKRSSPGVRVLAFLAEHALLALAAMMTIPVVMSGPDDPPLMPSLIIGVPAFVGSRLIARARCLETWAGLVVKAALFIIVVLVMHLRVTTK
ncbi:MAG: hypothetical protein IT436_00790 [Phycisphaerales bacterium]|nr:hypothetical protein [Phycisphaerales bacterium]